MPMNDNSQPNRSKVCRNGSSYGYPGCFEYLRETGELDNTFVLFISDNAVEGLLLEAIPIVNGRVHDHIANNYDDSPGSMERKHFFSFGMVQTGCRQPPRWIVSRNPSSSRGGGKGSLDFEPSDFDSTETIDRRLTCNDYGSFPKDPCTRRGEAPGGFDERYFSWDPWLRITTDRIHPGGWWCIFPSLTTYESGRMMI